MNAICNEVIRCKYSESKNGFKTVINVSGILSIYTSQFYLNCHFIFFSFLATEKALKPLSTLHQHFYHWEKLVNYKMYSITSGILSSNSNSYHHIYSNKIFSDTVIQPLSYVYLGGKLPMSKNHFIKFNMFVNTGALSQVRNINFLNL